VSRLEVTGEVLGLVPRIEATISVTERHRTFKVWRSLWAKMQAMGRTAATGPIQAYLSQTAPRSRGKRHGGAVKSLKKLVQRAWREEFYGLAACMSVAWDSMLSPDRCQEPDALSGFERWRRGVVLPGPG
jgi:hypothetical protein